MSKDRKPHFLGIGAQKSGTSWLCRQLRQHPEIYIPPIKELHYFGDLKKSKNYFDRIDQHIWRKHFRRLLKRNPFEIAWHLRYLFGNYSAQWYSSLFSSAGDRIAGEITPKYSKLSDEEIKEVFQINTDMRLIYLMRDPTSRAWSHFRMLIKKRGLIYDQMSEREVFDILGSKNCIRRGNYLESLERWFKVFSEDQLFIGYMEQVKRNPNELLEDILGHINVTQDTTYFSDSMNQPANVGQQISIEPKYEEFLREKFFQPNENLFKMLGNPIIKEWNKTTFS